MSPLSRVRSFRVLLSRAPLVIAERLHRIRRAARGRGENGMSTAEYALGTVAACAFAAVLYVILTSSQVRDTLTGMVTNALQVGG
ncbi:DUF4244 domain-containing protein [Marinactinospora rubrisoli]|uniref:DUF4244 domain-containing protein n=1 Tax=Marinactinospora rubrisoli TaxID=2715399 RepID=A0ABW2KAI5_9ACTN